MSSKHSQPQLIKRKGQDDKVSVRAPASSSDTDSENEMPSPNSLEAHLISSSKEEKRPLREEMPAIILLIALYTLQGIPLGLCLGSIPFLLQSHTSNYTQLGIFSLAAWPYSLKLLWSPIVDTYYINAIGRRKSWIIPTQIIIGLSFLIFSYVIDDLMTSGSIMIITAMFFALIVATATQDIAVDGWAITMLSKGNVVYASTSQSIGQNIGFFFSYSIFLALNNPNFSNHFRSIPSDQPLVTLPGYLFFWGWSFLILTAYLAFFKQEAPYKPDPEHDPSLKAMYMRMWRLIQLPNVQSLCIILLTYRLAFVCNDSITILKLTEMGFPKENMAIMVFLSFPFELVYPIIVGRWANSGPALRPFMFGYPFRMILCLIAIIVVYIYPSGSSPTLWFYALVLITQIIYSFATNLMFVSQCGFFNRISDDSYGGTYMTLLNTIANLGSTWPKFIVFWLVDQFTCKQADGCTFLTSGTDGYYIVSTLCFLCGIAWLITFRSRVEKLQLIDKKEWAVPPS